MKINFYATRLLILMSSIFIAYSAYSQSYPITPLSNSALKAPLVINKQGSFFIGGHDVASDTLSTIPAFGAKGTITLDQMYVAYQIPFKAKSTSVVLVHGCCLTGKTWESTPDNRMGWSEYFIRRGFPTYVIDQVGRGRSAVNSASQINAVKTSQVSPEKLPTVIAASHEGAWQIFRFGAVYPETFENQRFPIFAERGLWQQMVADWNLALDEPNATPIALSALSKELKKTVLISHSESGIFPFNSAKISNDGIAGIISIEPAACPPADSDLTPYIKIPSLVMFGDFVDQSTRWAPRLKACREFVNKVNAQGGKAELLVLPEIGINGNTHMMMQDNNSIELAALLSTWIENRLSVK
jgi:pimeloyl-ACP methyl ester carboxylesterase